MSWEELRMYLNASSLPWFRTVDEVIVLGYEQDLILHITQQKEENINE